MEIQQEEKVREGIDCNVEREETLQGLLRKIELGRCREILEMRRR